MLVGSHLGEFVQADTRCGGPERGSGEPGRRRTRGDAQRSRRPNRPTATFGYGVVSAPALAAPLSGLPETRGVTVCWMIASRAGNRGLPPRRPHRGIQSEPSSGSGCHAGTNWTPPGCTGCWSLPSAFMMYTLRTVGRSRRLRNAILVPSGDHAAPRSKAGSVVSCRGVAAVGVHHPHLGHPGAGAEEDELRAVGRPRREQVVAGVDGEADQPGPVGVDHEDVVVGVPRPAASSRCRPRAALKNEEPRLTSQDLCCVKAPSKEFGFQANRCVPSADLYVRCFLLSFVIPDIPPIRGADAALWHTAAANQRLRGLLGLDARLAPNWGEAVEPTLFQNGPLGPGGKVDASFAASGEAGLVPVVVRGPRGCVRHPLGEPQDRRGGLVTHGAGRLGAGLQGTSCSPSSPTWASPPAAPRHRQPLSIRVPQALNRTLSGRRLTGRV